MSLINKKFSFSSAALPDDTFDVVSFSGSEGLSKLYRFDVTLVADNDEIDLENVIQSRVTLNILREDGDITFHGILSSFEELETVQERTHYRAVLTPAFWCETLTFHNQIFLDKTIPEIIEAAMQDGGLTSLEYEFRLNGQYLPHEYVCQYNETHHSFVSRLMEREGIYYYFEQGESCEKVIITDTGLLHSAMAEGEKMYYSPPSGLDQSSREEVIKSLVCCQKILPARVVLKDYNYRQPSLELIAEATVSEKGLGDVYIYGEHFPTPEEGQRLAQIRAERLKCQARTFQGESLIPYLRPGYIFLLEGHNRKNFNLSYLTTDITHHGDQSFLLAAGLDETLSDHEKSPYYRNSFTAISSEIQCRPERTTEKPRFAGTMHAHIDAAGDGQYAEIDEQGRYKVRLPFDLNSPVGGKASSWIRMAQPYAGDTHGMHFPLHKGTEVLLTCIDGDLDRPIISAAVPNPLTPSPVTSANATQSRITTAGGNKIHIEDQKDGERILMHTPKNNTWFRMGTPNDPPTDPGKETNDTPEVAEPGVKLYTTGGFEVETAWENTMTMGEKTEITLGASNDILIGTDTSIGLGTSMDFFCGAKMEATVGTKIEYGKGGGYSYYKTNDLCGSDTVSIKAGGDHNTANIIPKAVLTLISCALANTAVAAGMGIGCAENKKAKDIITGVDVASMVVFTALANVISYYLIKKADKIIYQSSIELTKTKTSIESPAILIKSEVAATVPLSGIITIEAGKDINVTAEDNFKLTTTKAALSLEATKGNVAVTSTAGTLTNTSNGLLLNQSTAGNLTNNAKLDLLNTAGGTITNTGATNNLTATGPVNIQSTAGAVSVKAATDLNMEGTVGMSLKAKNLTVNGTGTLTLSGGVIKIGELATPVVIASLAASIDEKKSALEDLIAKQTLEIKELNSQLKIQGESLAANSKAVDRLLGLD